MGKPRPALLQKITVAFTIAKVWIEGAPLSTSLRTLDTHHLLVNTAIPKPQRTRSVRRRMHHANNIATIAGPLTPRRLNNDTKNCDHPNQRASGDCLSAKSESPAPA